MPPAAIRRPLTITTWLLISGLALVLSPLLLALAAIAGRVTGRRQPLLLARLLIAYFARELGVLVACGILWLASGFGIRMGSRRFESLHHTLLGWFVHGLVERARTLFEIEVVLEPSDAAAQALQADRPLLLFSRHAGPGDTALLVELLITRYDRRPSIVFKHTLAIDPCVDLIGHRLPHAILDTSEPEECEARIEQVAAELEPRGVLLLFPEGGNFTKERRRKALRRLWRKGRRRDAAEARRMSNVLPPHPGGVLAALRGNPDADVVFAAHTGLGHAAFPRELWHRAPIGATLTERMWLEPAAQHPDDPEEQVEWLNGWWRRLDAWIEQQPDDPVVES